MRKSLDDQAWSSEAQKILFPVESFRKYLHPLSNCSSTGRSHIRQMGLKRLLFQTSPLFLEYETLDWMRWLAKFVNIL
jgi:hypothetical protein